MAPGQKSEGHGERRLFVAWQHPLTRAVSPVACLTDRGADAAERYVFSYLKNAESLEGFEPFLAFPVLDRAYTSDRLFPFFENRTMSRRRADFPAYVQSLSLPQSAEPFDILERSGGKRSTDPIEVFAEPVVDGDQGIFCFFARGIRHVDGASEVAQTLEAGERLYLAIDAQNLHNDRALLLLTAKRRCIGFVPDYLVNYLHDMLGACVSSDVVVEVVHRNVADLPASRWLLCKVTTCWPKHYRAFADESFSTIVDAVH
jgi:hypothetical protein